MSKTAVSRFALADAELADIRRPTACAMCHWLRDLPPIDQAYLTALLAEPVEDKGHAHIARVIEHAGGATFSRKQVAGHRAHTP